MEKNEKKGSKTSAKKWLKRGIRQYEKDQLDKALKYLDKALEQDKNNAEVLKWLGNTKRLLNRLDEALADLTRSLQLCPNDVFALSRRAEVHRLLGKFTEAKNDFDEAFKLDPTDVWTLQNRGWLKWKTGDLKGALKDFNKANRLQRNNAVTLRKRGNVKRLLKDYTGALKDLNKTDQLKPNNAYTLRYRGDVKQCLGDFAGALEDLNRADQLTPNDALTLQARGITKKLLTDYEGASEDLHRANELEPNNADTLQLLGEIKRMLCNNEGALEDLNRADQIKPNNTFTLQQRAATKEALGDYGGALEDLATLDRLQPDDPMTVIARAMIYYSANKMTEAFAEFTFYDELVPSNNKYSEQKRIVEDTIWAGIVVRELEEIEKLGSGGYGAVYLAKLNGDIIAYKKSHFVDSSTVLEAVTIMKFRHENIVSFLGFCKIADEIALVMEYAKDGSLHDLLCKQTLELPHILQFAKDIAAGLAYLHKRNVIHRDLKSANILLFDGHAKISDFGQSRFLHSKSKAETVAGTLLYMAPEILAEEPYNQSADVYSFGVLLYEMCTGTTIPVTDETKRMKKIADNVANVQLQGLIMSCCRSQPTQRPTIQECLVRLDQIISKMQKKSSFEQLLTRGKTKIQVGDIQGALSDLIEAHNVQPNDSLSLASREQLRKQINQFLQALKDEQRTNSWQTPAAKGTAMFLIGNYVEALDYFNLAHKLQPSNAFTLSMRALTRFSLKLMHDAYIDFCYYNELQFDNTFYLKEKKEVEDILWAGIPHSDITTIEILGEGSFGKVHLATWNGQQVAVKNSKVPKSDDIKQEMMTLMKFCHDHIVSSLGFCFTDNNEVSLVMEYAKDGSLHDLLHTKKVKLSHGHILKLACNIASGLSCLHSRCVMHRDLKSANILLFNDCKLAKIADFGQARFLNEKSLAETITGTIGFVAPEILAEEPYNQSADVYSFGVLLYEMCTNTVLPVLEEVKRMRRIVEKVADEQLQELIMNCCKTDPTQRPTIQECLDRLNQMSK